MLLASFTLDMHSTILQDILIRWKRMQGYNTLWRRGRIAGIELKMVVERSWQKPGESNSPEMGRNNF